MLVAVEDEGDAEEEEEEGDEADQGQLLLQVGQPGQRQVLNLIKQEFLFCALGDDHIAPRGAKKEEAFGGVILKSERPSGALFTNSGPPFFTVESKIEVLSPLGTSFH